MHRSSGFGRDHRIDVLRGICLAMIFINHVPGNHFEGWTSRNFGFSDAAEGFVLISGISVGLAYSGGFRSGKLRDGVVKVWRRARTLYGVHILITLLAGALFAASLTVLDVEKLATGLNVDPLLQKPLAALAAIAGLVHQLGYFDILPLYIALLMAAPLYIVIGMHRPWTMLAGAAVLWLAAGLFRLNLPLLYADHGWQFNPFAWQLLFAFGLAGGIAARQGRKFVAYRPWLFALASAWLAFCFFWAATRQGPLPGADMLPGFLYGYDKPYLALPRLLHVLALAYVLTNIGTVGRLLAMKAFRPADLMGRQSLAVFAAGSLLAVFVQIVRFGEPANLVGDALLISGGLLMQYSLARFMAERKAGAQSARDHPRAGQEVAQAPAA